VKLKNVALVFETMDAGEDADQVDSSLRWFTRRSGHL